MNDHIEPIPTRSYDDPTQFRPSSGSVYIHSYSHEERSLHPRRWGTEVDGISVVEVHEREEDLQIELECEGHSQRVALRSRNQLEAFLSSFKGRDVYLDITGMSHSSWATLLRSAIEGEFSTVKAVYVEPEAYRFSATPTEGEIFDLSLKIRGLAPLPGFATLVDEPSDWALIPLLGFEGTRFSHVLENLQAPAERVWPVIGIPGFRLEYPYHTYLGNRRSLEESGSWRKVEYISANCPFGIFRLLNKLRERTEFLKVAMIGTKPHALGAVLFKISNDAAVELIYDHPIRKERRTSGWERLLVYPVSDLWVVA